jgi:hypothetical protein
MSLTLYASTYDSRYRCPECKRFVTVLQTTFGRPCESCGYSESRYDGGWDYELSRWRLVLGWPMIEWDIREGGSRKGDDTW